MLIDIVLIIVSIFAVIMWTICIANKNRQGGQNQKKKNESGYVILTICIIVTGILWFVSTSFALSGSELLVSVQDTYRLFPDLYNENNYNLARSVSLGSVVLFMLLSWIRTKRIE